MLLAFLVGAGDNELVLMLDTGPADGGNSVLEAEISATFQQVAWAVRRLHHTEHEHSHALARAFDAVRPDEIKLTSGDLDELGVRWVAWRE